MIDRMIHRIASGNAAGVSGRANRAIVAGPGIFCYFRTWPHGHRGRQRAGRDASTASRWACAGHSRRQGRDVRQTSVTGPSPDHETWRKPAPGIPVFFFSGTLRPRDWLARLRYLTGEAFCSCVPSAGPFLRTCRTLPGFVRPVGGRSLARSGRAHAVPP